MLPCPSEVRPTPPQIVEVCHFYAEDISNRLPDLVDRGSDILAISEEDFFNLSTAVGSLHSNYLHPVIVTALDSFHELMLLAYLEEMRNTAIYNFDQ